MSYFSRIFEEYDFQLAKNFDKQDRLNENILKNYNSFLEQFRNYLKVHNILFSLIITIFLLIFHVGINIVEYGWDGYEKPFNDFTWFLCFVIGVTTLIVLSAKYHLKEFTAGLVTLSEDKFNTISDRFLEILEKYYIGYKLCPYGIAFGFINTLFGFLFGIDELAASGLVSFSIYLLFFLAGFVNGIAVGGIIIVIKMIKSLNFKNEVKLDYFYPDKCAGTLKIGNILFIFSLYTIASGILIFIYLQVTNWSNIDESLILKYLLFGWKLFPFFMAGAVFLYPVFFLNRHLIRYKYKEQLRVRKRLSYINEMIMNLSSDDPKNKEQMELLDEHYKKLERIDQFINNINTWPYDLNTKTVFISVFLPVIIGTISEISNNIISETIKTFFQ